MPEDNQQVIGQFSFHFPGESGQETVKKARVREAFPPIFNSSQQHANSVPRQKSRELSAVLPILCYKLSWILHSPIISRDCCDFSQQAHHPHHHLQYQFFDPFIHLLTNI